MTTRRFHGIDGVLGNLISASGEDARHVADIKNSRGTTSSGPRSVTDSSQVAVAARRGRPLGPTGKSRTRKEKVTVWIPGPLANEFRDWSWEARCSLSSLVEKALETYRDRVRG